MPTSINLIVPEMQKDIKDSRLHVHQVEPVLMDGNPYQYLGYNEHQVEELYKRDRRP